MSKSFWAQSPRHEVFPGSGIVRRFAFRAMDTRGQFALFQQKDCFECLSPHEIAV